jgi:very-long-chain enoyl-CoA reductase
MGEDGKKTTLSDDEMPLKYVKLPKDKVLNLKNLGKQIRWDYVFYVEYLGPILILPIFYLLGEKQNYTAIQCWALLMGILHYLKR